MTLGKHHSITIMVRMSAGLHSSGVKRGDDIGDGESRANMADVRTPRLLKDNAPNGLSADGLQLSTRVRKYIQRPEVETYDPEG